METLTNIPRRAAGVLLALSSLPSPYGIGAMGAAARDWVDFLAAAGQRYWQVLPLGATGYGDSPYQSFSAFAGNVYTIDLDTLCAEGLLKPEEYQGLDWGRDPAAVAYQRLHQNREVVLRRAFARFEDWPALEAFCTNNAEWLEDYTLYRAARAAEGGGAWTTWTPGLRLRESAALAALAKRQADELKFHAFLQFKFWRQWQDLRAYANRNNVEVIGDIPFYVAMDSADVWSGKALFQFGDGGALGEVAGCPPDSFTPEGQLWGNPLYDWEAMAKDGYGWWLRRMRASFGLYDVLRIDHFRGLESYYAIPGGAAGAKDGRWRPGPGMALISRIREELPAARIIAEDLGYLTDSLRAFLLETGYPGMKVLQFAFDTREAADYNPYTYEKNNAVYTGTHDNDTALGWAGNAPPADVARALDYVGVEDPRALPRALVRLCLQNQAVLAVAPMQDWLGLGGAARMNTPGTVGGANWRWRLERDAATPALAAEMRRLTELYGRLVPD